LTEDESIFVIAGENRFSFGLGTEEPSVTAAMMELANSESLRPTLEKVLGPNPSLIEMTAITSSYGAEAQYWHDDVIPTASAIKYARSFGPSYSVFVQLQNTTKEMGATSACPGSYYCSGGTMGEYCEEDGFQVVGEDGHWNTGDALLMNMNSYHRGSAHIDPNGIDRVMLILTFVPQPNKRAESRQMSQGITFSLRWDMWYVRCNAGTRTVRNYGTTRATTMRYEGTDPLTFALVLALALQGTYIGRSRSR
jgi:ectoine hydroxylase-related dioxygenase (phytanoyl-CoA dioxygenase family)